MQEEDTSTLIACPESECLFVTSSLRKLGRHRSVTHADTKYACDLCSFVTGYQSNFYRHRKQVHGASGSTRLREDAMDYPSTPLPPTSTPAFPFNAPLAAAMLQAGQNGESGGGEALSSYYLRLAAAAASLVQAPPLPTSGALPSAMDAAAVAALLLHAGVAGQQAAAAAASLPGPLTLTLPPSSAASNSTPPSSSSTGPYVCDECGWETPRSRDLLHHLRSTHGEVFTITYCPGCPFATRYGAAGLSKHQCHATEVASETESEKESGSLVVAEEDGSTSKTETRAKLRCELCPYETDDEGRFKKHQRCHKTTAETACRLCDFNTVYSWNLDRHMRSHRANARYTCLRCSFSQNTRQSITFHLQHHHSIQRADADTQTDVDYSGPIQGDADGEPYVFEQHAVRVNPEEGGGSQRNSQEPSPPLAAEPSPALSSPATSHSPASPSSFVQKSGFAERFLKRYTTEQSGEEAGPGSRKREAAGTPETGGSGKKTLKLDETAVKKYLSETDAIETPSEEKDMKDLEKDPDVQTRVCSICGYQGKWISEMIRHKRVHTTELPSHPFKCRYCNRTSKWKADLIRHVAKVHGIRVVSKYSRSKTFDSDAGMMRALKEQHGFVDADPGTASPLSAPSPNLPDSSNEAASLLLALQQLAHIFPDPVTQTFAFRCKRCDYEDNDMGGMLDHGQVCEGKPVDKAKTEPVPAEAPSSQCHLCPFIAPSELALITHRKNHQRPTGLFNYKCAFCDWYSKKKTAVADHMGLHTSRPEDYMAEVERNLITPAACPLDAQASMPPLSSLPPPADTAEAAENNQLPPPKTTMLPMAEVSELVSDFSAIIDAAGGGDLGTTLQRLQTQSGQFPVAASGPTMPLSDGDEEEEEGDEDPAYIHAGVDQDSREIRKVSVLVEGKPVRLWQCRHCPHVSKRRANVRLHEKKHGQALDGEFQCTECDYRGDRRSLNAHLRVHETAAASASRRHPCPACPALFRSHADLTRHSVNHGSEQAYACTRCNYACDDKNGLAFHSVVHADEQEPPQSTQKSAPKTNCVASPALGSKNAVTPKPKKHLCSSCPARFADTTQLTRHVAFHGVDLAHKCPHCDYSVPFQINLIKHIKAHHGGCLDLNSNALMPSPSLPSPAASHNTSTPSPAHLDDATPLEHTAAPTAF